MEEGRRRMRENWELFQIDNIAAVGFDVDKSIK